MTSRELRYRLLKAMDASRVSVHRSRLIRDADTERGVFTTLGGYASTPDPATGYQHFVLLNESTSLSTQAATLAHEWAHILLGHTRQKNKSGQTKARNEIEAETVAMHVIVAAGVNECTPEMLAKITEQQRKTNRRIRYEKILWCVRRIKRGIACP